MSSHSLPRTTSYSKNTMKFAVLGLGIFALFASAAVPLYHQCEGSGWTGETGCADGAVCQEMNPFFLQCVANPTPTTSLPNPTSSAGASTSTGGVALYGQCGGSNYPGDTGCVSTAICKHWNPYYYQCVAPSIPAGAITVGQNGEGKYSTITQALADTSSNVFYVYPGNYTEQVVISRANITIYGQTSDKLSYYSNMVTVSGNRYAGAAGSNDLSGTVRISAAGAQLYNLNIENTFGKPIDQAQAIALSVQAGPFACYACQLRGYQDTLLANKSVQFYGKSLIQGSVDFIFGQYASIWITGSTINTVGTGYVTASGRLSNDSTWYVIDKTLVTGTAANHVYLGRPWRNYARVIFQNSYLDSNIVPAGWRNWSDTDPRTDYILFGEYNNTGPGAWNATSRPSFATQLTAPVDIVTVLNSTSWIDSAYL